MDLPFIAVEKTGGNGELSFGSIKCEVSGVRAVAVSRRCLEFPGLENPEGVLEFLQVALSLLSSLLFGKDM